jgi:fumarate hydratase class II
VNLELGLLDELRATPIMRAAQEVVAGLLDDQFIVDVFQTGSGTSTNMNANEVIASRANELTTGRKGGKEPIHPKDHVNLDQSSNDTFPTAIHIAVAVEVDRVLLTALRSLYGALTSKAHEWDAVIKIGRTHLMDAMPIRLGQAASGWARQVELAIDRLEQSLLHLYELPQGGTAVGTGTSTHPAFGRKMAEKLADRFGLPFREAENHFEAQHSRDAAAEMAGQLSTVASALMKIANDIRWLSSGPRSGIGELELPPVQPGSSIMPGKLNPVMA